jgi:hypothetical protein
MAHTFFVTMSLKDTVDMQIYEPANQFDGKSWTHSTGIASGSLYNQLPRRASTKQTAKKE